MSYPAEYIRQGLNVAASLKGRGTPDYRSSCRRQYFKEHYRNKKRQIVYGARVFALTHDRSFVFLAHDIAHSWIPDDFWLRERKRYHVLPSDTVKAKDTPAPLA